MLDQIKQWIVFQIVDKKRITIALIAGIQLAKPALAKIGVEIPDTLAEQVAAWGAVVVLAIWSKMNARKAEQPPG